jgi:phosphoglucomutase
MLVDVPKLVTAYYIDVPDSSVPEQQVAFGTSGHRGSALEHTFNQSHVLAISQAICDYRKAQGIDGPLFLGIDTHALSVPACASAVEVLAANGVEIMLAAKDEYTPTPFLTRSSPTDTPNVGLADRCPHLAQSADGGGFNNPQWRAAGNDVSKWIEAGPNCYRQPTAQREENSVRTGGGATHRHDFFSLPVGDLRKWSTGHDRGAAIRMGVDRSLGQVHVG